VEIGRDQPHAISIWRTTKPAAIERFFNQSKLFPFSDSLGKQLDSPYSPSSMARTLSQSKSSNNDDPNMLSWSQYLQDSDKEDGSESDDDFRDDSLNDADWDGQSGGIHDLSTR